MPKITFLPGPVTVNAAPGALLLDAARAAGLPAEAPCGGRGLCGKCLAQVESGRVGFTDTGVMPPGMAAEGFVLLCRASVLDEPATIRLAAGLQGEKGQFAKDGDDRLLVDAALFPGNEDIDPPVRTVSLDVAQPAPGDGLSDLDRLERAVKAATGAGGIMLPLPLLRELPEALRREGGRVWLVYRLASNSARIIDMDPHPIKRSEASEAPEALAFGIAVDIGTTTVAVQLVSLHDGKALGTKTAYNAQISCGLDVISRINYARKPERLEELRSKALETINTLICGLAEGCGVEKRRIYCASVAGNTTMAHLMLGIPPEHIRLDPYVPAVHRPPIYEAGETGLDISPYAPVRFAPSAGSYVGGDIASGLLCTSLATHSDDVCLFIDIGTNGEIALGNAEFLLGCACSAGPAFEGGGIDCGMRASAGAVEWADVDAATGLPSCSVIGGGKPAGICGSGMISLVASLFETGRLDAGGRLDRARPCGAIEAEGRAARYVLARAEHSAGGRAVYVSEADIANVVRAKAAIFSACRVLLGKVGLGFGDLARVYVAGGFGRYLDINRAVAIGLLPGLPKEKFRFIGNSSLMGAYMTLVSDKHREREEELARRLTYVDLSAEPEYMGEYTAALFLPHTDKNLFTE